MKGTEPNAGEIVANSELTTAVRLCAANTLLIGATWCLYRFAVAFPGNVVLLAFLTVAVFGVIACYGIFTFFAALIAAMCITSRARVKACLVLTWSAVYIVLLMLFARN